MLVVPASRIEALLCLCRFALMLLLPTGGCAGTRPGMASNFHLSRQMKVTKAKAPNTS